MSFEAAAIISILSGAFSTFFLIFIRPCVKVKVKNKVTLYILYIISIMGIAIYISFIICPKGKHLNQSVQYKEIPIEKVEKQWIYFDGTKHSFSEKQVVIEKPKNGYENVVVKETECFQVQWIVKINVSSDKYHVYMSEDVYGKWKNGGFVYERE